MNKSKWEIEFQEMANRFDEAWNSRNAAEVARFLTEDADFVFPNGEAFYGKKEIEKYYAEKRFLSMNPGVRHKLNLKTIRFLVPDAAIADFRLTISDAYQPDKPSIMEGYSTWILVKSTSGWMVSAIRVMSPK